MRIEQTWVAFTVALMSMSLASACGGDDDAVADGLWQSPCVIGASSARCDSQPIVNIMGRDVYWTTPIGDPPAAGFPAVVLYQGSLYGPASSWNLDLPIDTPFGGYYQVALIDALLRAGFVVVQPAAMGGVAWNTNSGSSYESTSDAAFIPELLRQIEQGSFDTIDTARLYATGISSGGYMTSRMAVSYPGRFRALAIQSASYATCVGPLCNVPATLPADHPPTLFLHGARDTTVAISTARTYYQRLMSLGFETAFIEDANAGHQWLNVAPAEITAWFENH